MGEGADAMMPGELYWVDYYDSMSRSQGGKRPAVVLQDDNAFAIRSPMVLTIPLTSQLGALRFPATLQIDPSSSNGLNFSSIALVFQTRSIDKNWLNGKIGILDAADLTDLLAVLDRLMG